MTLLYIDSFDHYDTAHIEAKGWGRSAPASSHDIVAAAGRRGTFALGNDSTTNNTSIVRSFTSSTGVVGACAMNISGTFGTNRLLMGWQNDLGNVHCILVSTGSDQLQLRTGSDPTAGTVLATTAASAFPLNAYAHYEFKLIPSDQPTGGLAEVKKDGIVILTSAVANTGESDLSVAAFRAPNGYNAADIFIDDLYLLNLAGSENNDYMGDLRVDVHVPDADGGTTNFVPNVSGDNYLMLDEIPPDDDTTFVEAGVVTDKDLYSMAALSLGTVIHGLQQVVLNKKTDAGTVTMEIITNKPAGSGEKSTATATTSVTYNYNLGVLEKDPDDSITWTDTRINATEFGYTIDSIVT